MKFYAVIVIFCSLLAEASGQASYYIDSITTRSSSGQFIIYGPRHANPLPSSLKTATNLVRLEPMLLAVSCERIKQALLIQLDALKNWRGKVFLALHPVQGTNDLITVNSSQFTDGWMYQIELPDALDPQRLVGALVPVLLLEIANRNVGAHSSELPAWLSEGVATEILAGSEIDLVLQPPETTINNVIISRKTRSAVKADPLAAAHEQFRSRSPLTLEQLSWPTSEQLSGRDGGVYRHSAQLFVHELLTLNNGPACLRMMVEQLPQDYNWQTTFLRTFSPHFRHQLDVEKWWTLQQVHFMGHELTQSWPREESWEKLDEIVRPTVQVHIRTNEIPLRVEVSLQTIIQEWDYARQSRALRDKVNELSMLRLRISPDLIPLVDRYRQVLETYLQKREKGSQPPTPKQNENHRPAVAPLVKETVARLNGLDVQRQALRDDKKPIAAVDAEAGNIRSLLSPR